MQRIGIIGLGRMGSAMALRLKANGCAVTGWTRSGRAIEGVQSSENIETLVKNADTLILSLTNDEAVCEVLDTLLTLNLSDKQIIETSTVVPDVLKDRIDQIHALNATAVDAPIAGGPELVLSGGCGVFIGGSQEAATRAIKTLSNLTEKLFHVGPLGAGLVMKTINNGMMQTYFNGLADLMPLANRAGLSLETAIRILSGGPAGLPMVADRIPKVLGEDTDIGFTLDAVFEDNIVFQRVVDSYGLKSPMLEMFGKQKETVTNKNLGDQDPARFIKLAYDQGGS